MSDENTQTQEAGQAPEETQAEEQRLAIALSPVESNQVKAVGYDQAHETLAVQFKSEAA